MFLPARLTAGFIKEISFVEKRNRSTVKTEQMSAYFL